MPWFEQNFLRFVVRNSLSALTKQMDKFRSRSGFLKCFKIDIAESLTSDLELRILETTKFDSLYLTQNEFQGTMCWFI